MPEGVPPGPARGHVEWREVPCPLCGADQPRFLLTDTLRRPGARYEFRVVACTACGMVYVSPRGEGAALRPQSGGAARRDAARVNQPIYAAGLRLMRQVGLPETARLLDVGCARGDFLAFAAAHGCAAEGLEIHPDLARHARERGFVVHEGDLRSLDLAGGYDAVTLWDVIEHVDDPVGLLAACARVVAPGGLVLFHTGNAAFQIPKARWLYRLRPDGGPHLIPHQHLTHFSPSTAASALERGGWEPLGVWFAATLRYPGPWKRLSMRAWNAVGQLPPLVGGPLLTNAMAALGRRPRGP